MKTSESCTITALILLLVGLTGCFYSNPKDIKAFLRPEQAEIAAQNYILRPPDEIVIHCSVIPELHLQQQLARRHAEPSSRFDQVRINFFNARDGVAKHGQDAVENQRNFT